jgi:predicted metal-dependent peptidase
MINLLSLSKSKVKLLIEQPFFASILMKMRTEITDKVPRAAVDGVSLFINPTFFDDLEEKFRLGVLAHEVLHVALLHHTRMGKRMHKAWNVACDYAINLMLKDAKIEMPTWVYCDEKFRDMSAEEIYELIKQDHPEPPKGGGYGQGEGQGESEGEGDEKSLGDVLPFPSTDPDEIEAEERQKIQDVIAAHQTAKDAGKEIGGIQRLIEDFLDPKVSWHEQLQCLLSEKSYDDYTWTKPNRRYMAACGFYLPKLESETYGEVVISQDTSGSLTMDQLKDTANEISCIQEITRNKVTVLYVDTRVADVDVFERGDDLSLRMAGGGGTCFRPPFEWIEDEMETEPVMMIYFTDGYCNTYPNYEPDYHVVWCVTTPKKSRVFDPPFGDVIYIDN